MSIIDHRYSFKSLFGLTAHARHLACAIRSWLSVLTMVMASVPTLQGQILESVWEHVYNAESASARKLAESHDGRIFFAGYDAVSDIFGTEYNAYYAQADPSGQIVWSHRFDYSNVDELLAITALPNGGAVLTGATGGDSRCPRWCDTTENRPDVLVVRIDASGERLWLRTYGDDDVDVGRDVIRCDAGGFLVAGSTRQGNDEDVYVLRLNDDGTIAWQRQLGDDDFQQGYGVVESENGNIIVIGHYRPFEEPLEARPYVVKLNEDGDVLWERVFGDTQIETTAVTSAGEGAVLIGGQLRMGEQFDAYVAKVDASGDVNWQRRYASDDPERPRATAKMICRFGDGFLVLGSVALFTSRSFALCLDTEGNPLWRHTFEADVIGSDALQGSDGALVMLGSLRDIFLAKFRFNGFRRADPNADNRVNISDAVAILLHLFAGADDLACEDAADIEDSGDIDLGDAIFILNFLFLDGPPPWPPGSLPCAGDETEDNLGCEIHVCS